MLLLTNWVAGGGDKCGVMTNTDSFCQSKSQVVPSSHCTSPLQKCMANLFCVRRLMMDSHVCVSLLTCFPNRDQRGNDELKLMLCALKRKSWLWFAILPCKLSIWCTIWCTWLSFFFFLNPFANRIIWKMKQWHKHPSGVHCGRGVSTTLYLCGLTETLQNCMCIRSEYSKYTF